MTRKSVISSYTQLSPEYKNVGLVANYICQQFDQFHQPKLVFKYKDIFEALNLNDYYQNEFDYSFFFASSIPLFYKLGYKIISIPQNEKQIIVVQTII